MLNKKRFFVLSGFELWCIGLVAVALLIAGNAKLFLQRYDLISSSALVHQQLTSKVSSGLQTLDSFTITPAAVTFITWGVIGLVTFSIVQSLVRASGLIQFERDISSNRYVHPVNFDRRRFWKRIATDALLFFVLLSLLLASAILYPLYVVPVSFNYVQDFLLRVSLAHIVDLALGIFTIYVGTAVVYVLFKAVVLHHRLSMR